MMQRWRQNGMPLIEVPEFAAAHAALHKLWTKAASQPDYDKREWKDLDNAIEVLGQLAFPMVPGSER